MAKQNNGVAGTTAITPEPHANVPTTEGNAMNAALATHAPATAPARRRCAFEVTAAVNAPMLAAVTSSIAALKS